MKIATMNGNSFTKLVMSTKDFVEPKSVHLLNTRIQIDFVKKRLVALSHSCNGYAISRYAADCLAIEAEERVFINVPPVNPVATEIVTFSIEETTDDKGEKVKWAIVSYDTAGFSFRTKQVKLEADVDKDFMSKTLETAQARPHIQIAFNANYAIALLNAIKRGSTGVKRDMKPVVMEISGEDKPIIFYTEPGADEKMLLPVRPRTLGKNAVHMNFGLQEPKPMFKGKGKAAPTCPCCGKELRFLSSKLADADMVKNCPYCGQAITKIEI